jgi:hypothetical protein
MEGGHFQYLKVLSIYIRACAKISVWTWRKIKCKTVRKNHTDMHIQLKCILTFASSCMNKKLGLLDKGSVYSTDAGPTLMTFINNSEFSSRK